ncbi:MAG: tRNA (adenosine(37)-N6)-dimethylallyltransferase, partial [Bacteroidales bacterium]
HLIDICEPGYKYNLFEYQHDFFNAYESIKAKGKLPVLCGGTGLYIESVLKAYRLFAVPENKNLREALVDKTLDELTFMLSQYKELHNTTDVDTVKRAIRAIEIEEYYLNKDADQNEFDPLNSLIIGVDIDRELRREKISKRLKMRFDEGMLDEVKSLLDEGIAPEDLIYYGLEYKFMTQHLIGEISYAEMYKGLETAIHQFAKRQMTWFRGMERRGFKINWLDATIPDNEKVEFVMNLLAK